jgi:outer membrane protein assembly factor BamB
VEHQVQRARRGLERRCRRIRPLYGATSDYAFALDATTGKEVWRSEKLTRNANEGVDMAPAVFDGRVYVSTVPGNSKAFYSGNGVGRVFALDAQSGQTKWSFNTVPTDLWSTSHVKINSGRPEIKAVAAYVAAARGSSPSHGLVQAPPRGHST